MLEGLECPKDFTQQNGSVTCCNTPQSSKCGQECARQKCESTIGYHWISKNYSNPKIAYTCCQSGDPADAEPPPKEALPEGSPAETAWYVFCLSEDSESVVWLVFVS